MSDRLQNPSTDIGTEMNSSSIIEIGLKKEMKKEYPANLMSLLSLSLITFATALLILFKLYKIDDSAVSESRLTIPYRVNE